MRVLVQTHLLYTATQPCDLLLQIEASSDAEQTCCEKQLCFDPGTTDQQISGEEGIGTRRWVKASARFECNYQAVFDIKRTDPDWSRLGPSPREAIPSDVVKYLMPSRYCHSEQFLSFASEQFGDLSGGDLVAAMRDWINGNFTYDINASHTGTTATDSFSSQRGVCRDYAHVMIACARAAGIPARFVSVYAPDVKPQDFHAVVEVYLAGGWHIVDPTGMAKASQIVRICVGRDAADASFMTSYGWMELVDQSVKVERIPE